MADENKLQEKGSSNSIKESDKGNMDQTEEQTRKTLEIVVNMMAVLFPTLAIRINALTKLASYISEYAEELSKGAEKEAAADTKEQPKAQDVKENSQSEQVKSDEALEESKNDNMPKTPATKEAVKDAPQTVTLNKKDSQAKNGIPLSQKQGSPQKQHGRNAVPVDNEKKSPVKNIAKGAAKSAVNKAVNEVDRDTRGKQHEAMDRQEI